LKTGLDRPRLWGFLGLSRRSNFTSFTTFTFAACLEKISIEENWQCYHFVLIDVVYFVSLLWNFKIFSLLELKQLFKEILIELQIWNLIGQSCCKLSFWGWVDETLFKFQSWLTLTIYSSFPSLPNPVIFNLEKLFLAYLSVDIVIIILWSGSLKRSEVKIVQRIASENVNVLEFQASQ